MERLGATDTSWGRRAVTPAQLKTPSAPDLIALLHTGDSVGTICVPSTGMIVIPSGAVVRNEVADSLPRQRPLTASERIRYTSKVTAAKMPQLGVAKTPNIASTFGRVRS